MPTTSRLPIRTADAVLAERPVRRGLFRGLSEGLGDTANMIVADIAFDADMAIDTQVDILKNSGADIWCSTARGDRRAPSDERPDWTSASGLCSGQCRGFHRECASTGGASERGGRDFDLVPEGCR